MLSDRDRLARNLKEAREAKGISQDEAAAAVRKSRGTIANWEKIGGEFEPRSAELTVLAKIYGISTKDLRYLPVTLMVLRRPNEGALPAWLERAIVSWPRWLRGGKVGWDSQTG